MSEDYEYYDQHCPKCGHDHLHRADCGNYGCDDGYVDESDEDFCEPGTVYVKCEECRGTGSIVWCPNCGANLTGHKFKEEEEFEDPNQLKLPL